MVPIELETEPTRRLSSNAFNLLSIEPLTKPTSCPFRALTSADITGFISAA
jgi:hypothetical protein